MTNINFGGVSGAQLRQFIEKVETLEENKTEITENIRDVFAEAKAQGFDVKIMRQVMKLRRMKQEEVAEQEELLDLYMHALGMKIEMPEAA